MAVDRLSKYDAIFYYTDTRRTAMQVSVGYLFAGPIDFDRYLEWVAPRLERLPRLRMVLNPTPLNLRRPYWTPAADFDLSEHVVSHTLTAPGNEDQLRALFRDLAHRRLPFTKPLWQLHVINGLEDGGSVLFLRSHHCMADAGAILEIMTAMMEATPVGDVTQLPPTRGGMAREAHAQRPLHGLREWLSANGRKRLGVLARFALARGARFPFTRPASGRIKVLWRRVPLAEIREIRKAFDATVTDVILAALGSAMDAYAERERVSVNGKHLLLQIPANVRMQNQYGEMGNELTMLPGLVPLGLDDPVEQLRRVAAYNRTLKELDMAPVMHGLMGAAFGAATPPGQAFICRLMVSKPYLYLARMAGLPPKEHALVSSIVMPPFTYSVDGQPLTGNVNIIAGQFNMGIALSPVVYDDEVMLTLSVDAENLGSPEPIMEDMLTALVELRTCAVR